MSVATERYRQQQAAIASTTAQRAADVVRSAQTGAQGQTTDLAWMLATFVGGASLSASILADAWTSALLEAEPIGLAFADPTSRLNESLLLILTSDPESRVYRVERLAKSEPQTAARTTATNVMQRHKVTAYRWELDEDPCPECIALGSRVWPIEHHAISHPNCTCIPIPILTKGT